MSANAVTPLVSVVMPVYNGEQTIAEAIRSVQAQTYEHWNLTIGNNCSTDGTAQIIADFVATDPRIRVFAYPEHVPVIDSHNIAFTLVADQATYCKFLGADDWLFPNCLEEFVRVAEAHPTIGMVAAYILHDSHVNGLAVPYPTECVSGREIVRRRLLFGEKGFGGSSSNLLRADIVRRKRPFYTPGNYSGDIETYLDLLLHYDLGFVHQPLSYKREGAASPTSQYASRVNVYIAADLSELRNFGPLVLTAGELKTRLKAATRAYYAFLGASVIELRDAEFWNYHLRHFPSSGHRPSHARITASTLLRILDLVGNPKRTVEAIIARLRARRGRAPSKATFDWPTDPPDVGSSDPRWSPESHHTAAGH